MIPETSDATLMALAGHLSREMTEHYSHVEMAAERSAVEALNIGTIAASGRSAADEQAEAVH